jgi:hypothetical protein
MNLIRDEEGALRAIAFLRTVIDEGAWRLTVDDVDRAPEDSQFELSIEWGKLLLSIWSDKGTQIYRVIAYEKADNFVRLQARKGIARMPVIITLCRTSSDKVVERSAFLRRLEQRLRELDPTLRIVSSTAGARRSTSLRSGYARLVLAWRGMTVLAAAVSALETQQTIDGIVELALVWAARFNQRSEPQSRATELWVMIPRGRARTVMERLTLITTSHIGVRMRCIEIDETDDSLTFVGIAAQMELLALRPRRLRWPRQMRSTEDTRSLSGRILALAPDLIEVREMNISRGERFMIHGLEFARWSRDPRRGLWFGVDQWKQLSDDNFEELALLVQELEQRRSATSSNRRHAYYRLREEAWLESVIRRDITAFDPCLNEGFVYSQVPAWRDDERSVLDVLTIDRRGRLVILEIKASEDPMLPLQGLDYWMRVEQARRQRQFEARGLFSGVEIADASPLLYLVSPRLRFHRTFADLSRCLANEAETWRVSVNSNWRAGLKILSRERVNP